MLEKDGGSDVVYDPPHVSRAVSALHVVLPSAVPQLLQNKYMCARRHKQRKVSWVVSAFSNRKATGGADLRRHGQRGKAMGPIWRSARIIAAVLVPLLFFGGWACSRKGSIAHVDA